MGYFNNMARIALAFLKTPFKESSVQLYSTAIKRGLNEGKGPDRETVQSKQVVLDNNYRLVLIAVLGLTIGSGLLSVYLASAWTNPTLNQQAAFEAMDFVWKSGTGAFFGLLGGKAS